jgi:hypothetical protein
MSTTSRQDRSSSPAGSLDLRALALAQLDRPDQPDRRVTRAILDLQVILDTLVLLDQQGRLDPQVKLALRVRLEALLRALQEP